METKEIIMLVVVGLLVILAVAQTVQLVTLRSSATGMTMPMSTGSSSSGVAVTSGHSSSASSLDNLPSMVGGC